MEQVKFYFSTNLKLSKQEVVINNNNEVLAVGNLTGSPKNFPRVTICGILDKDKSAMVFGVTRCSTKDIFVKSVGREIAFNRALNNPYRVTRIPKNSKISEIFMKNCLEIEDEVLSMEYPISIK